jgi:hypothetical protein
MMDDMRAGLAELGEAAGVNVREPEAERATRVSGIPGSDVTVTSGTGMPDTVVAQPEPAHVDTGEEEVAEFAEPGAEEGAGPEVRVAEPWPNYHEMTAPEIVDRLAAADEAEIAVVRLYESRHRNRRTVLEATDRVLRSV